jgi:hypothetical protein
LRGRDWLAVGKNNKESKSSSNYHAGNGAAAVTAKWSTHSPPSFNPTFGYQSFSFYLHKTTKTAQILKSFSFLKSSPKINQNPHKYRKSSTKISPNHIRVS